jgi:hypothetical protein
MSCCASTSSTTTPTARTDHCMNARPRAVPRHLPARSPDRSDVTGSAASYTSTSRSQDMTGFAAPTGWRTARSSGLSPSLRASLARLAGGQTSRQRSTRSGLLPLATSSQGCAGFSTAPRATPTRLARWPPCRHGELGHPAERVRTWRRRLRADGLHPGSARDRGRHRRIDQERSSPRTETLITPQLTGWRSRTMGAREFGRKSGLIIDRRPPDGVVRARSLVGSGRACASPA